MNATRFVPIWGSSALPLILAFFVTLFLAFIVYQFFFSRIPRLPRTGRDWGSAGSNDPRVALAAMMYAVATEEGTLSLEKERHILSQLTSKVGLEPDLARTCLAGGKRLAGGLRGDLNSRLHQLVAPIETPNAARRKSATSSTCCARSPGRALCGWGLCAMASAASPHRCCVASYAHGFSTGRLLRKASGIRPPSAPAMAERSTPASTKRRFGASFLRCQMSKVPSRIFKGTAENWPARRPILNPSSKPWVKRPAR